LTQRGALMVVSAMPGWAGVHESILDEALDYHAMAKPYG
jgi:hypothetical protein